MSWITSPAFGLYINIRKRVGRGVGGLTLVRGELPAYITNCYNCCTSSERKRTGDVLAVFRSYVII